jgi:tetratricopeptide (TPR) repeat protein
MPRRPPPPAESLEDRWLLEAQTARNLEGLEAEQAGRLDEAIVLYERNVREGFPGDWPYGRLVAIYERRQAFDDARRVLERAIEVLEASRRRTPRDRRAMVRAFKQRLSRLERQRRGSDAVARPRSPRAPARRDSRPRRDSAGT